MRLVICQFDIQIGEIAKNLATIIDFTHQAKEQGADLIAFPESALAGYCFTDKEEAQACSMTDKHPALVTIQQLAHKLNILIALGYIEQDNDLLYNTGGLFGLDENIRKYRKAHTLLLGLDRFVEPGNLGFPIFNTPHGKIGINICYDQRFPEAARQTMLNGAQLILTLSNIPKAAEPILTLLTRARAFENRVYYAMVNRVGEERATSFIGQSAIISPFGEELATTSTVKPMVTMADLDLSISDQKKSVFIKGRHEVDLLGDRRSDLYNI